MKKYDTLGKRKERLTITLSVDLLSSLDNAIDGKIIRNRSHAMEHFLRKTLKDTVTTAVIFAGGEFKTKNHPSFTFIGETSLIDITLNHLSKSGIKNIYILAGKYKNLFEKHIEPRKYPMRFSFIDEPKPMGTGGALKLLESIIVGPFLLLHGDVLTNISLQPFIDFYFHEQSLISMAVKPRLGEPKYGQVILEGNRISKFVEHDEGIGTTIVNTGVYLMSSEVFSYLPKGKYSKIEVDVFPKLATANQLSAFFFQGMWFDISTYKNLREVTRRYYKERG